MSTSPLPRRNNPIVRTVLALLVCLISLPAASVGAVPSQHAQAGDKQSAGKKSMLEERRALYDHMAAVTHIPWYRLAAIDQYERTMTTAHPKDRRHSQRLTGIVFSEAVWAGALNPDPADQSPRSIALFSGVGLDGSGDGLADRENDLDLMYTMSRQIIRFGLREEDFHQALWSYYHNSRAVQRIQQFARMYQSFDTLDLHAHAFPLPVSSDYSYRSTWGSGRSWGGYRIHEGTDLFARYGVPVRSTCFGIVEVKGWNPFGGWRIGIRDLDNHYHYYAHLSGYDKSISTGDLVKPGQTLGWVGSSGYGKPGTQGKFPPHLHYGIYRDNGLTEWSFDPYPLLHQWENAERTAIRSKKKGPRT
ncbi:M23 family metallopeptidase [Paenibacillus sp. JX-17]|uniref:M23 family metallopeptidase n=1 Tax=Paenibacillus lacisoli TaxID=3064525 RepID=A0ABT9CCV9_9BACL|nr:M23 family metallopeptidase [Paenibacillus sp. JX-17]MDO7907101.1 M23 family metallopeptidase [Paenibacillus sp. JX-17]